MEDVLREHLTTALIAILAAAVPVVVAWLRLKAQELAIRRVAVEADERGAKERLPVEERPALAKRLASERVHGLWHGTPSDEKIEKVVADEMPKARARRKRRSTPPEGFP